MKKKKKNKKIFLIILFIIVLFIYLFLKTNKKSKAYYQYLNFKTFLLKNIYESPYLLKITPSKTPTPLLVLTPIISPLPIPSECGNFYRRLSDNPRKIVIHYNDDPYFRDVGITYNVLKDRGKLCYYALSENNILDMRYRNSSLRSNERYPECGCVGGIYDRETLSIEVSGTDFDLWVNLDENNPNDLGRIVSPDNNPSRSNEDQTHKRYYDEKIRMYNWTSEKYLDKMRRQTDLLIRFVSNLLNEYSLTRNDVYGHFQLWEGKTDPGIRYLEYVKRRLNQ